MTKEKMLVELRRLSPQDRAKVLVYAATIRAARDAGDMRPAQVIVAPILATFPRKQRH
jgi:hypothetical protein